MAIPIIERRFYTSVSSLSSDSDTYTIPNGQTLYLTRVGGDATTDPATRVDIIWDEGGGDEEIIFSTYLTSSQETHKEFIGDGSTGITIKLTNNSLSAAVIGGFWIGSVNG